MTREEILKILCDVGVIPVVRAKSAEALVDLAKALHAGGIPICEVTLTVPGAIEAIRRVAVAVGKEVLVGVGSVTSAEQVEEAVAAGAQFIVGPVLVPEVIAAAHKHEKPVIPGAFTPTEIFQAHSLGADVIKVFPASVGGPSYFKAILAPMPYLKLMPTGGVDLSTAAAFIKAGAVALGAGASLVDSAAIEKRDWATITNLAREFRAAVKAARGQG